MVPDDLIKWFVVHVEGEADGRLIGHEGDQMPVGMKASQTLEQHACAIEIAEAEAREA
jgi:hypothetical protein